MRKRGQVRNGEIGSEREQGVEANRDSANREQVTEKTRDEQSNEYTWTSDVFKRRHWKKGWKPENKRGYQQKHWEDKARQWITTTAEIDEMRKCVKWREFKKS